MTEGMLDPRIALLIGDLDAQPLFAGDLAPGQRHDVSGGCSQLLAAAMLFVGMGQGRRGEKTAETGKKKGMADGFHGLDSFRPDTWCLVPGFSTAILATE
jgi:hypothetical protein